MNRRSFLRRAGAAATVAASANAFSEGLVPSLGASAEQRLAHLFEREILTRHIPGVSACLVHRDGHLLWARNFGLANIATNEPMSFEHVQNIASISKTFVTVAAMQQVEAGLMALDDDVNEHLPFAVRHPKSPGKAITVRMLMRHISGLRDGTVYSRHYGCGDPRMSLGVWVRQYFEVGGVFYNENENFAPWSPGEKYEYCNVSYGLLGYLVERTSGLSFPDYCARNIFAPLGMDRTAWMISEIAAGATATQYSWVEQGAVRGPTWGGMPLGVIKPDGPTLAEPRPNGFDENCQYNHSNYLDGFLRMSVDQMVAWARLWMSDGSVDGVRLLNPELTKQMFTDATASAGADELQGLTWYSGRQIGDTRLWGHSGSDPGVSTSLLMARTEGIAAIVFTNTNGARPSDFAVELLREGLMAI